MQRTLPVTAVAFIPLVVCLALSTPRLLAEPISTEESLDIPSTTLPEKQEANDAMALFKARDYNGALKLWQEAVKKNPEMPPAQLIMAQLYIRANMLKEAQNALNQAIVDAPADPEPYMVMASFALRDRDWIKAESLLQKAGDLLPKFDKSVKRRSILQTWLQNDLAMLAEARNDWPGAQKALETLLKMDPKNVSATQRLAYCLMQQKNVDGALEKLREAVKIEPTLLTPEATLAQYYQRSGDLENVKKWMKAAIAAAPKDMKTRLAVGQCALEMGLMDDAQKNAVAAMKINSKALEAEFFRGLVALCQKDYRTAETYFDGALKRAPANASFPISNNLALALIEQEEETKTKRALEYAEANAKKFPKSPNATSTYGWVLYRAGKLNDAEKALQAASAAGPLSVDSAYYTARVAVDRGRKSEAKQMLETALKTPGRSMFRQDAEDLLEELKKEELKK